MSTVSRLKHFFVLAEIVQKNSKTHQELREYFDTLSEAIPFCRDIYMKYPSNVNEDVCCTIYERNESGCLRRYGHFVPYDAHDPEPDFYTLFEKAFPCVYNIVKQYDGMLLDMRLMDSVNHEVHVYAKGLKAEHHVSQDFLEVVMKECFYDSLRMLEKENESKYGDLCDGQPRSVENSFVCQCLEEISNRNK